MEWLVGCAISGVICACIASSRNRDPIGWFIGGCLFGIFAIIPAACMSKGK
jgi:hypothetical protein